MFRWNRPARSVTTGRTAGRFAPEAAARAERLASTAELHRLRARLTPR
jgi:hypothetical protein